MNKAFKKQQKQPLNKEIQETLLKRKIKNYNNIDPQKIDLEAEIDKTLYFEENLKNLQQNYPTLNWENPKGKIKVDIEKYEYLYQKHVEREKQLNKQ